MPPPLPDRMADTLSVQGIAVDCRIGVSEEERTKAQTIWIDLELAIDAPRAAAHDDVRDALDYAKLVAEVRRLAQSRPYNLLEALTEATAAMILKHFNTASVRVRIRKRALPDVEYAAVEIVRP